MSARIGMVIGQLSVGGAERQITILANGFKACGYEAVVICLSSNIQPFGHVLSKNGIEWQYYNGMNFFLLKVIWLIRQVRNYRCSLIYGFLHIGNIYGGLVASLINIPFIGSIRSSDTNLPFIIRWLSSFFCNRADHIISNSSSNLISLSSHLKVHHERVSVIHNALAGVECSPVETKIQREIWNIDDNQIIIGTVANLKIAKNPIYFLEVCLNYLSMRENNNVHFVWIGEGSEHKNVRDHLNMMPWEIQSRIHFPGATNKVGDALNNFNIFILTSNYEGLPNALLEAMKLGVPCVVTDVPGVNDVFKVNQSGEEIGILVPPGDPKSFAKAFDELLQDKFRMKKMSIAQQCFISEYFSLEKMVNQHCQIFEKVLAEESKD